MSSKILQKEADYFSKTNNKVVRNVSWSSVQYFQEQITLKFDFWRYLHEHNISLEGGRALTLGCGDMTGEYQVFKDYKIKEIDAFDISDGQRKKFYDRVYDNEIKVNYNLTDCNKIELEENKYDFIYMQHSYHHFENVDGVAEQLNKSLKPDGLFLLIDYIGEPFLQRSPKQRKYARVFWPHLPKRLRKHPNGKFLDDIYIPDKNHLSPYEAVCSDKIMDALEANFIFEKSFVYGGILFPIFQGFAPHYLTEELDEFLIKMLWDLDQQLIETDVVDPNYIRAILRKKE